jgi:hypothetical protein
VSKIKEEWKRLLRAIEQDPSAIGEVLEECDAFGDDSFLVIAAKGIPLRDGISRGRTVEAPEWVQTLHVQILVVLFLEFEPVPNRLGMLGELAWYLKQPLVELFADKLVQKPDSEWHGLIQQEWPEDVDDLLRGHPERGIDVDETVNSWAASKTITSFFDRRYDAWYLLPSAYAMTKLNVAWHLDISLFCELAECLPLPQLIYDVVNKQAHEPHELLALIESAKDPFEDGEWSEHFVGLAAGHIGAERIAKASRPMMPNPPTPLGESALIEALVEWSDRGAIELAARLKWEVMWATRRGSFNEQDKCRASLLEHLTNKLLERGASPSQILELKDSPAHEPVLRFLGRGDTGVVGGRTSSLISLPHVLLSLDVAVLSNDETHRTEALEALAEAMVKRNPGFQLLAGTHDVLLSNPRWIYTSAATLLAADTAPSRFFSATFSKLGGHIHRFRFATLGHSDLSVLVPVAWWIRVGLEGTVAIASQDHIDEAIKLWTEVFRAARQLRDAEPAMNPFNVDDYVSLCFAYLPHISKDQFKAEFTRSAQRIANSPNLLARSVRETLHNKADPKVVSEALHETELFELATNEMSSLPKSANFADTLELLSNRTALGEPEETES